MTTPAVACFCRASIDFPRGEEFVVVVCPGCGEPWAVWVHDGELAAQVNIRPGMSFTEVRKTLGLYGVRVLARKWESPEACALFVSKWTARRRWEAETAWGRRLTRFFALPGVRRLNRPPLWLLERVWRRFFEPAHLDRMVALTPADVERARLLNRGMPA